MAWQNKEKKIYLQMNLHTVKGNLWVCEDEEENKVSIFFMHIIT